METRGGIYQLEFITWRSTKKFIFKQKLRATEVFKKKKKKFGNNIVTFPGAMYYLRDNDLHCGFFFF